MRLVVWKSRALAMGLVFAAAGFCYAVSNFESAGDNAPHAGARAVGSTFPLRFTNPLVGGGAFGANEYDLGDACFGSTIARYVTADGGLKPYRFTSAGSNSFANVIEGFRTDLQFGISGLLAGSVPPAPVLNTTVTGAAGFRFQVTVSDAKGTNVESKTGFFNLFLVDCADEFRFAVSSIPAGRLAESYVTNVEVIGGFGKLDFSLESITGVARIEDLGLSFTSDGALVGKPLQTGTFTLRVRCTDSRSQVARSRDNSTIDQLLTLVISDNPITSSDLTTLQCSIKADLAGGARDTLKYKGMINVLGQDNFTLLNSQFTFRVAGVKVTGRLDKNGRFSTTLADRTKVKVKVTASKGSVDVAMSNGTFSEALGFSTATPPVAGLTRRGVHVSVGDAVSSSEALDFETDVSGTRYRLEYRLGRTGFNAGGTFQIVSVKGKDSDTQSGQPGDRWKVGFLIAAREGVTDPAGRTQGLDNVTRATVRIGENFTQVLTGATLRSNGLQTGFRGSIADGVRRFSLNGKRNFGKLDTNVISTKLTGITQAVEPPTSNRFFSLGVDLVRAGNSAPFTGEHARRIFGLKNQYRDRKP